jgi:multidrug resistance efflux pump
LVNDLRFLKKVMPKNANITLRSEEVQEILTRVPHWMVRWGSVVVLFILVSLLFVSWFIKYPDIVPAQIIITTNVPPQKVVANTSGSIAAILVKDRALVIKNSPLAIIENTANYKDVFRLSLLLSKDEAALNNFPFEQFRNAQLGDVENAFAFFQKEYMTAQLNARWKPYDIESKAQSYEIMQLKERLALLVSQKENNQNELLLQKNDLGRYETLFNKGIIAAQELERHKLSYLQVERNYKNLLGTISQLKSSLNELNKNSTTTHINENKEYANLNRNLTQAFYQLKKAIKDWELNYVLRASIDGRVNFLQLWSPAQTVNARETIFAIIPTHEKGFIGKAKAVSQNSGKIKIGQMVNIKLFNYPDNQFGMLKGKITAISLVPDATGNLLINVALPNGLQTSYKKQIIFQQEMSGTADIVTEDLRLIERLLYQFRAVFKR